MQRNCLNCMHASWNQEKSRKMMGECAAPIPASVSLFDRERIDRRDPEENCAAHLQSMLPPYERKAPRKSRGKEGEGHER